ncbi:MAG: BatA and WFA domain-containing protein [Planctomycetales bacterium]|nr:BatA and WFA domain-containing protein [Planctomycetales bacterium]
MDSLFRNTLGPASWFLLSLIPLALFALYFLKLKRQPLEVPSTYLWHRVIEDLHVNSLWQRLRKSLLLFLQLLLLALAMLALLRPGWQGQALEGQQFIFLIDKSASMSATDTVSGESRLEEAKRRVETLIDQLDSDMTAMIIAFAEQPEVVQEFTDNRRLLREALDRIEPTASRTDLTGALELADGFANPRRLLTEEGEFEVSEQEQVELYIFSDGRFRGVEGFSLGNLQPLYLPIGSFAAQNLAITALNARRGEERPDQQQAFVQVANFGEQPQATVVELYLEDRLIDAVELEVPAGDVASTTFALAEEAAGQLRARLDPPQSFDDTLRLDNEAYAVLEDRRDARVLLVTPGNTTLESALATERANRLAKVEKMAPAEMEKPDYLLQSQSEVYDLIIYDQCVPQVMPLASTLFVGRLPPTDLWKQAEAEPVFGPQIIDWERGHPLLNLIELGNVQIVDTLITKPPLGGGVLVDSTKGPIFAIAPRDRYEDAVLGFEIVGHEEDGTRTYNTDWPRKHSFPTFWLNVLDYFAHESSSAATHNKPDLPVELRINSQEETLTVELPDSQRREVQLERVGRLAFHETGQLGVYKVYSGGQVAKQFAVNLFDREESDVRLRVKQEGEDGVQVVDSLSIGYVDVAAQSPGSPVRRELWKLLLAGALVVLVFEWYIYNRRVYI